MGEKRKEKKLLLMKQKTGLSDELSLSLWSQGTDMKEASSKRLPLTFIAVSSMPAFLTSAFVGFVAGSVRTAARLADS